MINDRSQETHHSNRKQIQSKVCTCSQKNQPRVSKSPWYYTDDIVRCIAVHLFGRGSEHYIGVTNRAALRDLLTFSTYNKFIYNNVFRYITRLASFYSNNSVLFNQKCFSDSEFKDTMHTFMINCFDDKRDYLCLLGMVAFQNNLTQYLNNIELSDKLGDEAINTIITISRKVHETSSTNGLWDGIFANLNRIILDQNNNYTHEEKQRALNIIYKLVPFKNGIGTEQNLIEIINHITDQLNHDGTEVVVDALLDLSKLAETGVLDQLDPASLKEIAYHITDLLDDTDGQVISHALQALESFAKAGFFAPIELEEDFEKIQNNEINIIEIILDKVASLLNHRKEQVVIAGLNLIGSFTELEKFEEVSAKIIKPMLLKIYSFLKHDKWLKNDYALLIITNLVKLVKSILDQAERLSELKETSIIQNALNILGEVAVANRLREIEAETIEHIIEKIKDELLYHNEYKVVLAAVVAISKLAEAGKLQTININIIIDILNKGASLLEQTQLEYTKLKELKKSEDNQLSNILLAVTSNTLIMFGTITHKNILKKIESDTLNQTLIDIKNCLNHSHWEIIDHAMDLISDFAEAGILLPIDNILNDILNTYKLLGHPEGQVAVSTLLALGIFAKTGILNTIATSEIEKTLTQVTQLLDDSKSQVVCSAVDAISEFAKANLFKKSTIEFIQELLNQVIDLLGHTDDIVALHAINSYAFAKLSVIGIFQGIEIQGIKGILVFAEKRSDYDSVQKVRQLMLQLISVDLDDPDDEVVSIAINIIGVLAKEGILSGIKVKVLEKIFVKAEKLLTHNNEQMVQHAMYVIGKLSEVNRLNAAELPVTKSILIKIWDLLSHKNEQMVFNAMQTLGKLAKGGVLYGIEINIIERLLIKAEELLGHKNKKFVANIIDAVTNLTAIGLLNAIELKVLTVPVAIPLLIEKPQSLIANSKVQTIHQRMAKLINECFHLKKVPPVTAMKAMMTLTGHILYENSHQLIKQINKTNKCLGYDKVQRIGNLMFELICNLLNYKEVHIVINSLKMIQKLTITNMLQKVELEVLEKALMQIIVLLDRKEDSITFHAIETIGNLLTVNTLRGQEIKVIEKLIIKSQELKSNSAVYRTLTKTMSHLAAVALLNGVPIHLIEEILLQAESFLGENNSPTIQQLMFTFISKFLTHNEDNLVAKAIQVIAKLAERGMLNRIAAELISKTMVKIEGVLNYRNQMLNAVIIADANLATVNLLNGVALTMEKSTLWSQNKNQMVNSLQDAIANQSALRLLKGEEINKIEEGLKNAEQLLGFYNTQRILNQVFHIINSKLDTQEVQTVCKALDAIVWLTERGLLDGLEPRIIEGILAKISKHLSNSLSQVTFNALNVINVLIPAGMLNGIQNEGITSILLQAVEFLKHPEKPIVQQATYTIANILALSLFNGIELEAIKKMLMLGNNQQMRNHLVHPITKLAARSLLNGIEIKLIEEYMTKAIQLLKLTSKEKLLDYMLTHITHCLQQTQELTVIKATYAVCKLAAAGMLKTKNADELIAQVLNRARQLPYNQGLFVATLILISTLIHERTSEKMEAKLREIILHKSSFTSLKFDLHDISEIKAKIENTLLIKTEELLGAYSAQTLLHLILNHVNTLLDHKDEKVIWHTISIIDILTKSKILNLTETKESLEEIIIKLSKLLISNKLELIMPALLLISNLEKIGILETIKVKTIENILTNLSRLLDLKEVPRICLIMSIIGKLVRKGILENEEAWPIKEQILTKVRGFLNNPNTEVIANALLTIGKLAHAHMLQEIEAAKISGILSRANVLLLHKQENIINNSLSLISSIAKAKLMNEVGASMLTLILKNAKKLLAHSDEQVLAEALSTISNFTEAGIFSKIDSAILTQAEALLSHNSIQVVINAMDVITKSTQAGLLKDKKSQWIQQTIFTLKNGLLAYEDEQVTDATLVMVSHFASAAMLKGIEAKLIEQIIFQATKLLNHNQESITSHASYAIGQLTQAGILTNTPLPSINAIITQAHKLLETNNKELALSLLFMITNLVEANLVKQANVKLIELMVVQAEDLLTNKEVVLNHEEIQLLCNTLYAICKLIPLGTLTIFNIWRMLNNIIIQSKMILNSNEELRTALLFMVQHLIEKHYIKLKAEEINSIELLLTNAGELLDQKESKKVNHILLSIHKLAEAHVLKEINSNILIKILNKTEALLDHIDVDIISNTLYLIGNLIEEGLVKPLNTKIIESILSKAELFLNHPKEEIAAGALFVIGTYAEADLLNDKERLINLMSNKANILLKSKDENILMYTKLGFERFELACRKVML